MYCSRLFCSIKFVLQKIIITEDSMGWTQSVKVSVEFSAACWFLEASATKRQLVLSWHSLRCANHPFYACALDSWQLSFKPLLSLTSATCFPWPVPSCFVWFQCVCISCPFLCGKLSFLLASMGVNGSDAFSCFSSRRALLASKCLSWCRHKCKNPPPDRHYTESLVAFP